MEVYIDNKELEKLYTSGQISKLRLPRNVIERFFTTIQKIAAAITICDFWKEPSMNFNKIKGKRNRYSISLDDQYILEMNINWEDVERTVGVFFLISISNHYEK